MERDRSLEESWLVGVDARGGILSKEVLDKYREKEGKIERMGVNFFARKESIPIDSGSRQGREAVGLRATIFEKAFLSVLLFEPEYVA